MRRYTTLMFMLTLCLLPVLSLSQSPASGAAPADVNQKSETEILLSFTGDCTLGSEDRLMNKPYAFHAYIEKEGYAYPFEKVQSVFANDDVTVINLENVFYDSMRNKIKKTYNFRGPTDFARILKQGSIELSFLGNNHTYDYSYQGFRSTVQAIEEQGLDWIVTTDDVIKTWIYEKDGIKIGFTGAYITYFNRKPEKVKQSFEELKAAGCDFIVSIMHGGEEYGPRQNRGIIRFAKFLADQGAGLVVGHHPHVLHGMEIYNNATIIYSLGNFSFGGNAELRSFQTMIAQATLRFDEHGDFVEHQVNLLPAHTSGTLEYNNYQPVLVHGLEAQAIIDLVSSMSEFTLEPYEEGVGAWQKSVSGVSSQP
ncbi:MAG: CapA family protein [Clostridiales bacterium]|nr:CapA family protein [Clostridiales bacterium]